MSNPQTLAADAASLEAGKSPPAPKTPPEGAPAPPDSTQSKPAQPPPEKPPILDKGRRAEVAAETIKVLGSFVSTAFLYWAILFEKGIFTVGIFTMLLVASSKDELVGFIRWLTNARTRTVEENRKAELDAQAKKVKEEEEKWQNERMKLAYDIAAQNVEIAKLRTESEMKGQMLTQMEQLTLALKGKQ